jgi:hypothetical protein
LNCVLFWRVTLKMLNENHGVVTGTVFIVVHPIPRRDLGCENLGILQGIGRDAVSFRVK